MGRTACNDPQCLYKGALYILLSNDPFVHIMATDEYSYKGVSLYHSLTQYASHESEVLKIQFDRCYRQHTTLQC